MLPQILPKDKLGDLLDYLCEDRTLFAPVAKGPQFAFERIAPGDFDRIATEYTRTILPPKKVLLPCYEELLHFASVDPTSAEAPDLEREQVLFGVHPYDLHGIASTDGVMLMEPLDEPYQQRRGRTWLIGVNVNGYVDEHQFMADMGTLEPPEGGYELFLTDLGDRFYVEVGSEAGAQIVTRSGAFRAAKQDDHDAKKTYDAEKASNCPTRLPYSSRYLPELLEQSYDSLLWDAIARRCFSCGTCTSVCPTCYCFDVQDELNIDASSGIRRRKWDSCQLRVFAEVAGGENFREECPSRLRHRMFRKGKFIKERTGKLGCVGCGRCTKHCVARISILEAFQQIATEAAEV